MHTHKHTHTHTYIGERGGRERMKERTRERENEGGREGGRERGLKVETNRDTPGKAKYTECIHNCMRSILPTSSTLHPLLELARHSLHLPPSRFWPENPVPLTYLHPVLGREKLFGPRSQSKS
jgi:hypothetical protein